MAVKILTALTLAVKQIVIFEPQTIGTLHFPPFAYQFYSVAGHQKENVQILEAFV